MTRRVAAAFDPELVAHTRQSIFRGLRRLIPIEKKRLLVTDKLLFPTTIGKNRQILPDRLTHFYAIGKNTLFLSDSIEIR